MFWFYQNGPLPPYRNCGWWEASLPFSCSAFKNQGEKMIMGQQDAQIKHKGGRPKKAIKRDQLIALKCTMDERKTIEEKAAAARLYVSEYLRELGLTGKIISHNKALPAEALQLTATLNHLAANLNQLARKRNGKDELGIRERSALEVQSRQLKELVERINSYIK